MSINESHDIDLANYEAKRYGIDEQLEEDLDEFVGSLQDAFATANANDIPQDLISIALQKTFQEYYEGVSLIVEAKNMKTNLRTEFTLKGK